MNVLNTVKLLYYLQRHGIVLWCADGKNLNYSSHEPISDQILEKIKINKQDLIHFLVNRKLAKAYQIPYIFPLNLAEYPLSPAQERLWFLAQLQENDNYVYNEPIALTFDEQCNIDFLRKAIAILVQKHSCFRTLFQKDMNGVPKQIILPFHDDRVQSIFTLNIENIDDQKLPIHLNTRIKRAFDLSIELPMVCDLYHLNISNQYVLYILQHHIITDGTSIGLFLSEFYTLYEKLRNDQETNFAKMNIQYSDYALWFREYYNRDNLDNQLAYWKNKLEGFQILQIQKDFPKTSESHSLTYKYEIDSDLFNKLQVFSKNNQTTLFVSLLAAFYILLNKYSNQNDIVVGTPMNGRNLKQVEDILGFFINTVVLRAKMTNQRVCDLLLDIHQLYMEAMKYQDLPFEVLVDSMGITRSKELSPIFQVLFAYQKFVIPGVETDNTWFDHHYSDALSKFDITFDFKETDNKLIANIQYKSNLFLRETILRMSTHYINILRQMIQYPDCNINNLNILSKEEYHDIIYKWNSVRLPYQEDKTIHQFFEEQVAKTPNSIAVTQVGLSLTYFELNQRANKLSNLIRLYYLNYYKTDLGSETFIVISMESCLELAVAILAVIKAGCAYVPIDVNYPEKRKSFILEDTNAKLIITKKTYYTDFKGIVDDPEKILVLEKNLETVEVDNINPQPYTLPTNIVYVIYTSGSTGNPKGVCITHLSLNNFVFSVASKINLSSKKILTVSSFTFDMFCFDFYCSLCLGGTLILTDNVMVREPDLLVHYIEDKKPDIIIATPSLWHMIIDKLKPSSTLTILSAGEALHENLAKKLFRISKDVWDAYGPTETTVFSIIKRLNPMEQLSLGKPIPNVTAYILNEHFQPVPIGVVGELYIGGDCLAKGYLNRPELTNERFINNPFVTEDERRHKINLRVYKTGDLAYWLPSGDIRYVGRNDFQVKVSGHRIELEELEVVLNQVPKLRQCFVLPIKSEMSMQLIVYYTAEHRIEESTLRDYLAKSLPSYMMPHRFIYLDRFPMNNNGKIDIKNLPKFDQVNVNENIVLPRNSIEKEVGSIIANLLNVSFFSVDKNIFDVGCDSLKAVQVQTKLNEHFNSKIKVVDVFYYPTVEKLALLLSDNTVEIEPNNNIKPSVEIIKKDDNIAIIGYACSFPMSDSVDEYWNNIKDGKECIKKLKREECVSRGVSTDILDHTKYSPYAGLIPNIDMFDTEFWELSEHDAIFMDPKMRLFLEQAWKAIESSGYIKKRKQVSIGLFAAFGKLDYLDHLLKLEDIKQTISYFDYSMLGSSDYFLNRIAYLLGINGPLLSVDTACSSASVAVVEACEKLLSGKCDLAIVGGVNLCSAHEFGHVNFEGAELLSKDGHSRIFDERGGGIVRSDGIGVVVLKRYSLAVKDQDYIRAVIKGYGVSHDGMRKFGNMYPRLSSLKRCISEAQQNLESGAIDYIECHGMGFKLGELFEFDALRETVKLRPSNDNINKCMLGSVKANIGHTGYASGIAQLIKIACMLEHRTFPPQINYDKPHIEFNLENEPFQITKEVQTWQQSQDKLKVAGMTSFGIGGTNVHIILEEPEDTMPSNSEKPSSFLICLSAKSSESLRQMRQHLSQYLDSHSGLYISSVSYTLHLAREEFNYRVAFVCHDTESCVRLLQSNDANIQSTVFNEQKPNLIFDFSNVIEHPTISQSFYDTIPIYRDKVDHCAAILKNYLNLDIREVMSSGIHDHISTDIVNQSTYSTCISLVHSYAVSQFLQLCGLKTQFMVDEGVGKLLAACLTGMITLDDMFKFVLNGEYSKGTFDKLNTFSKQNVMKLISSDSICIRFTKDRMPNDLVLQLKITEELIMYNNNRELDDYAYLLNIISKLWLKGVWINWQALYPNMTGPFIELPTYSFEKKRINVYQEHENHVFESMPV